MGKKRPLMQGVWMPLEDFGPDVPLYPDGLLDLVRFLPPEHHASGGR